MKPLFSAIGLIATGSLFYLFKNYVSDEQNIIEKQLVKQILIILRKRIFNTLRQIAFIVNNIKANQNDFQPKKISDIIMKDGGTGAAKLNLIQSITLQSYNLTKQSFKKSCNFYRQNDYQIRILSKNLTMDIQLALKGTIQAYNGPIINLSSQKVIQIYRQILARRMQNIRGKLIKQASDQQILQREFYIQQYLESYGIKNQKQSNQKTFISILQQKYRQDYQFRINFENLELQMHEFTIQIQKQHKLKLQSKIQNELSSIN